MPLNVLVTLDGSDKDERAVSVAAALLELTEGRARVVQVLPPGAAATPAATVQEAAARLGAAAPHGAVSEVLTGSDIAAALLNDIEVNQAHFVVMSTNATGSIGRAVRGSIADHLVRESTCPVIVVPPCAQHLAGKELHFRRVLVPFDGSLAALSAQTALLSLPRANMLEAVLMQVVRPERTADHVLPPGVAASDDGDIRVTAQIAEKKLTTIAQHLRDQGMSAEIRVVEARDAGAALIDATRHEHVDFIAMTTRGAGGLQRLVLGSVAEYVVQRSEMPVLLVTGRSSVTAVNSTIGAWR